MEQKQLELEIRTQTACPACGYHLSSPLLSADYPLAITVRPGSEKEAQNLERLPLDYVRCLECGHIYNYSFDYHKVPYSDQPYPLFNKGSLWSEFISDIQQQLLATLPEEPTVVEIGHGDGSFLARLQQLNPKGRYVGFDVSGARDGEGLVEFRMEMFNPEKHLPELVPDLIVSRHVLEHLSNPLGFLQSIAWVSTAIGISPLTYFEVPCGDRVLETGRTVDFFYEHNSHFTTNSFNKMLSTCSAFVERIGYGYGREVLYGISRLGVAPHQLVFAQKSNEYQLDAKNSQIQITQQLEQLHSSGMTIAVWGGLGRSSTFMNRYGMDAEKFPVVVDSDASKVGTFVPGTGQEIRFRDWLRENPVDVVVIPSQWRSADIVAEMERTEIMAKKVLIEHKGKLVDYHQDNHPYRK